MGNNEKTGGILSALRNIVGKSPARSVILLAIAIFLLTGLVRPNSLNKNAFVNIITLSALLSIASAGQTMVLIGAGMDFSVGAVMSSAAVMTTYIMRGQEGHFLKLLALALLMGASVGFLNGFCVVKIRLPAMIVTMAISNVVSRLQYVFTAGTIAGAPAPSFVYSVNGKIFGGWFPNILFYAALIYPIVFYLLNFTRFGKQLSLSGNNPVAGEFCGYKVDDIRILTYVFSGILSAFAGMLGAAYLNDARCDVFNGYAFDSLVAVIMGGTSFSGGIGSFTGTIAGAVLVTVISNTLTIFQFSQPTRNLANGLILIVLLMTYNRAKAVRQ